MNKFFASLAFLLFLAGCTAYSGWNLRPGQASLDEVMQAMGPPAMRWDNPDRSIDLVYPRGPIGFETYLVTIGPNGRLASIRNLLTERNLYRITLGMSEQDVLRIAGPPAPASRRYFPLSDQILWEWHFQILTGTPANFFVLFDAATHHVRWTGIQVEDNIPGLPNVR